MKLYTGDLKMEKAPVAEVGRGMRTPEALSGVGTLAIAAGGVLYGLGWFARSNALATLGVGEISVSRESAVSAGLVLLLFLLVDGLLWLLGTEARIRLMVAIVRFLRGSRATRGWSRGKSRPLRAGGRVRNRISRFLYAGIMTVEGLLACFLASGGIDFLAAGYPRLEKIPHAQLYAFQVIGWLSVSILLASGRRLWVNRHHWLHRSREAVWMLSGFLLLILATGTFGAKVLPWFPQSLGGFSMTPVEVVVKGGGVVPCILLASDDGGMMTADKVSLSGGAIVLSNVRRISDDEIAQIRRMPWDDGASPAATGAKAQP